MWTTVQGPDAISNTCAKSSLPEVCEVQGSIFCNQTQEISLFFSTEDALLRKLAIMSGSQASRAWMGGLPGVQVRLQLPNMDSSWWPVK